MLMLRISLCVLAMSSMASAFIPSSVGPMSSLRLGGNRATVSRLTSLPKLAKGLRMTIAMPPLGELENLEGKIPDCPNTIWNAGNIDLAAEQAKYRAEGIPDSPHFIDADPTTNAMGLAYFEVNKAEIMDRMRKHGAVLLRGFDVTKTPEGFRAAWQAMGLNPCLDPIHNSGLRSMLSKKDAVYEEVNKQSLCQHYIGLHNESTFKKTAVFGAFVCFSPASKWGGEFFIADGAKIFRDLRIDVLERLYNRNVRISVSNLDLDFLNGLGPLKTPLMEFVKDAVGATIAPKFDMDLDMIYGADGKATRLQAIEHAQPPINRHPETGKPVWFCNVHNHARYLRDKRPCSVPEVGMTEVYYGDLSRISAEDLDHIDEVSRKHIVPLSMQPGDTLLIDNYRLLHGRDIFEGERLHAVSWFRRGDEPVTLAKPGNLLNNVINSLLGN
jgi:hypothetical protein